MATNHADYRPDSDRVLRANALLDNLITGIMKGELKPQEIVEIAVRAKSLLGDGTAGGGDGTAHSAGAPLPPSHRHTG